MSEVKILEGLIKAVSQKDKGYGINIEGDWFNGFGECEFSKGDKVLIKYTFNGKFNSIHRIELLEKVADNQKDERLEDIHLQVCLKCTCQLFQGSNLPVEDIVKYTKELHSKLWG